MHAKKLWAILVCCFTLSLGACGLEDTSWCEGTIEADGTTCTPAVTTPDASTTPDAGSSTDPCSNRCGAGTICDRDTGDCVADVSTPDAGTTPDAGEAPVTTRWYLDADSDGEPVTYAYRDEVTAPSGYTAKKFVNGVEVWDCDDRPVVGYSTNHSNNGDLCGDYIDNDCDGSTDEGCSSSCTQRDWFRDHDNDRYPVLSDKRTECEAPIGYIAARTDGEVDCDDNDLDRNPGRSEILNNSKDDDCRSYTSDTTSSTLDTCVSDPDEDGYVVASASMFTVSAGTSCPRYYSKVPATQAADCGENDFSVNPGRTEIIGNNKNDDCKDNTPDTTGSTETCYRDGDGDGVGKTSDTKTVTSGTSCESGYVKARSDGVADCNDGNTAIKPGATEQCNGVDDDCDGQTDEDFRVGQACDGDYGICRVRGVYECNGTSSYRCSANPGGSQTRAVPEVSNNNTDDDCDNLIDEGASNPSTTTVTDGFTIEARSGTVTSVVISTDYDGFTATYTPNTRSYTFRQVVTKGTNGGTRHYIADVFTGNPNSWGCLNPNTINVNVTDAGIGTRYVTTSPVSNNAGGCKLSIEVREN